MEKCCWVCVAHGLGTRHQSFAALYLEGKKGVAHVVSPLVIVLVLSLFLGSFDRLGPFSVDPAAELERASCSSCNPPAPPACYQRCY